MKIFDASSMIAFLGESNRPCLVDDLLKLGHDLAIPGHVMEKELLSAKVRAAAEDLVRQGKVTVLEASTPEEVRKFRAGASGLGLGEIDTMLAWGRMRQSGKAYCILDDARARSCAARIGVPFTGVLGLLRLLGERGIVDRGEIAEIVAEMRRSGFRIPANIDM